MGAVLSKQPATVEMVTKEIWRELMAQSIGRSVTRHPLVRRICSLATAAAALKQKEFEQFLVDTADELKRAPFLFNSFYGLQKIIRGVFASGDINFGRILATLAYCFTVFKNWLHSETSIDIWIHMPTKLMAEFDNVSDFLRYKGGWSAFLQYFTSSDKYFYFCANIE